MENKVNSSSKAQKKNRKPRWLYWLLAIAVLAIVACFGAKPAYFNYKSGQLIAQNYAPWSPDIDFDDETGMDADESMVEELSELFANVGSGTDIKITTFRLENALRKCAYDDYLYLYYDDIRWYLALAYIQQNKFGSARTMLKSLKDDDESDYAEQAEALYRQIENMYFM